MSVFCITFSVGLHTHSQKAQSTPKQTSPNRLLWSLKYFWWGCFAPRLLHPG